MAPNGPDLDRVVTVARAGGVDEGTTPNPTTAEVVRGDQAARSQWGPAAWEVDQLFTLDVNVLAGVAGRALALRAKAVPRVDTLDLSPVADAAVGEWILTGDPIGDLLSVTYRHHAGWWWSFPVHVHGVAARIVPAGVDHRAAVWELNLTLDDATWWLGLAVWGTAVWGQDVWNAATYRDARAQEAAAWA